MVGVDGPKISDIWCLWGDILLLLEKNWLCSICKLFHLVFTKICMSKNVFRAHILEYPYHTKIHLDRPLQNVPITKQIWCYSFVYFICGNWCKDDKKQIHVCMYICTYVHTYVCVCVFCLSVCLSVCLCLSVCPSVCMYVCMYVFIYVCMYVFLYTQ